MNLVGYTATALSRNDIEDTPTNKNVVDFAIVELKDLQGNLVVMYDDAEGLNPETQKTCDTNGQVTFFAEIGDYDLEINGKAQRINLAANTADYIKLETGESVQEFADSFALKIFQSPTDGGLTEIQTRTVNASEVYEVRKTSDDSLATIYSDADGTTEIAQNGTDNLSGGDGVVEFYIADGDYYVVSNGESNNFEIDVLRQDLANPDKGADLIAYSDSASYAEDSIGWAIRTAGGSAFAPSRNVRYVPLTDGIQVIASRLRDGVLYGTAAASIYRSFDKGATWTPVGTGTTGSPNLLVNAGDGEVISACTAGGLYRSQGWAANPETCTWVRVLHVPDSDFLSWGLDSTGDGKLVCSHYRATDYTKSRYVWLSDDSGVNWQPILDLGENTYYHLHCVAFDPWANNRIWVSYHADPSKADRLKYLGYTDDDGATWVQVSDKWQPTTAVATPHGMTFGTDDGGGGVLHIPRTENPADMQVVVAAPFPVEQTDYAWVFAIYGEYDETTGVAYHSFISQVTSVDPYGDIGTPAGIFATDGINASQLLQVDDQANANGFREFALIDKDVVFKTRLNSPDDVTGTTTSYSTFIEKAVRGASAPLQFDTGRMFGGKLLGDNPYRSLAVGTRSVAGPGGDATAIGNLAKAETPFPGATAIGSRAQALGTSAVALGFSSLGDTSSVAIGGHALAGIFGISVGRESSSDSRGSAVGYRAKSRARSVAFGNEAGPRVADVSSTYAAIGDSAKADSFGVALGGNAVAYPRSVALGYEASASTESVALGYQSSANHASSVAFPSTQTSQTNEVAFGPRVLTLHEKAGVETPDADSAGLFLRRTGDVQELCIRFANGTIKVVVTDVE